MMKPELMSVDTGVNNYSVMSCELEHREVLFYCLLKHSQHTQRIRWTADYSNCTSACLCCVYTMYSVTTDAEKLHLLNSLILHMPRGWHSSSTHGSTKPVELQFSRSWAASPQKTSLKLKPAHQCLSRSGFCWVLLQVSLCVCVGSLSLLPCCGTFSLTLVSAANTVCRVNRKLKVITLKYPNEQLPCVWWLWVILVKHSLRSEHFKPSMLQKNELFHLCLDYRL